MGIIFLFELVWAPQLTPGAGRAGICSLSWFPRVLVSQMFLECSSGEILGGGQQQSVWEGSRNSEAFLHTPPSARLTHPGPSSGQLRRLSLQLPPETPLCPPLLRKLKLL